jgi:2-hydroxychromene-2-carboxylate isomerase
MANFYHPTIVTVNATAVTGRYLAHNHLNKIARAFLAADLVAGTKSLMKPTALQAAMLARVNPTYAWWAYKRQAERMAILAGHIPLVPAPTLLAPKANGRALSIPQATEIDDDMLTAMVRAVGIEKTLSIASAVEREQIHQ